MITGPYFTGEKRERYIPILIEDAYRHKIPKTIKHLYHLDYTRIDESIFWKRLANCLSTEHESWQKRS